LKRTYTVTANAKDRIPYESYRDGWVHKFWQYADHVRGLWRTAVLASYLTDTPDWEDVLDNVAKLGVC